MEGSNVAYGSGLFKKIVESSDSQRFLRRGVLQTGKKEESRDSRERVQNYLVGGTDNLSAGNRAPNNPGGEVGVQSTSREVYQNYNLSDGPAADWGRLQMMPQQSLHRMGIWTRHVDLCHGFWFV
eukprot:2957404-Rhodomonas_salina.1